MAVMLTVMMVAMVASMVAITMVAAKTVLIKMILMAAMVVNVIRHNDIKDGDNDDIHDTGSGEYWLWVATVMVSAMASNARDGNTSTDGRGV